MKNVVLDEIFKNRIVESNIFNNEEQKFIKENYLLYKKCYYLGILERGSSSGD